MKLIGRSSVPSTMFAGASSETPAQAAMPSRAPATDELPYLVRRGRQLLAAFAKSSDAANWVRERSYHPDSEATYVIQTDDGILCAYRNGDQVEFP